MSQEFQVKVCRIFASGQPCRFGSNCRFSHPQPSAIDHNSEAYIRKPKICRSYAETRFCKFGARCRFFHPSPRPSHNRTVNKSQNAVTEEEIKSEVQAQQDKDDNSGTNEPYYAIPLPNRSKQRSKFQNEGKFSNSNPTHSERNAGNEQQTPKGSDVKVNDKQNVKPQKPARRRLCRYFKSGDCYRGDRCQYWHPENRDSLLDGRSTSQPTRSEKKYQRGGAYNPNKVLLKELNDDQRKALKKTEEIKLQKRYPKSQKTDNDDDSAAFHIVFVPSDPDWPYDVKNIEISVTFPDEYPLQAMSVSFAENQEIPEIVSKHIEKSAQVWIAERFQSVFDEGKAELMFLPWLKWLDRSLEEIMTVALRNYKRNLMAEAAGVQFISAEQLQQQYTGCSSSDTDAETDSDEDSDEDSESDSEDDSDDDQEEYGPGEVPPQPSQSGEMPPENRNDPKDMSAVRKGTEVKLRDLQLLENACTLMAKKVKVIVVCDRCKNKSELTFSSQKPTQVSCMKCSQDMVVAYRPSMAHQFSSVIGYLDVKNCQGFDVVLLDCIFAVGCFNCNKDVIIEGLHPGESKEFFCRHCHKKMKIVTQSVRLQQLHVSEDIDVSDLQIVEVKKKKKMPKDPAIQEGKPLPYEGTCKHYKKSYRWLRFPCCGKAYPCDVCHEENEGDHDMVFANRMICGFCCKEQVYSGARPCISCGYSLVKLYSSHWEGGKGCRDKVKMSRDDKKKYSNMSKCVSRKSEAKKSGNKGKKITKLRHT